MAPTQRTARKSGLIMAAVLLAIPLIGGCGDDADDDGPPSTASTPASTSSAESPDSKTSDSSGTRGGQQALAAGKTASAAVGGGAVTSIETEDGGQVWEVKVVTDSGDEHEVVISADGKRVVSGPTKDNGDAEDRAENRRLLEDAELGYRAAIDKVLAARDGTITGLNLDAHRGSTVWEAEVRSGGTPYEVTIDAGSGKVIRNQADEDDDD